MTLKPVEPGAEFGRLRVLSASPDKRHGHKAWYCLCDPKLGGCGRIVPKTVGDLRHDNSQSCGCLRSDSPGRMYARGALPVGEARGDAKLTREIVIEARRLRRRGLSYPAIRDRFRLDCAWQTVQAAVTGRTWKSVPMPED